MTKYIRYEDIESYVEARDGVVEAAIKTERAWQLNGDADAIGFYLTPALDALRSLHADRGLRDPSTPGEQEPDAEPEHGQAVHPGGEP